MNHAHSSNESCFTPEHPNHKRSPIDSPIDSYIHTADPVMRLLLPSSAVFPSPSSSVSESVTSRRVGTPSPSVFGRRSSSDDGLHPMPRRVHRSVRTPFRDPVPTGAASAAAGGRRAARARPCGTAGTDESHHATGVRATGRSKERGDRPGTGAVSQV